MRIGKKRERPIMLLTQQSGQLPYSTFCPQTKPLTHRKSHAPLAGCYRAFNDPFATYCSHSMSPNSVTTVVITAVITAVLTYIFTRIGLA